MGVNAAAAWVPFPDSVPPAPSAFCKFVKDCEEGPEIEAEPVLVFAKIALNAVVFPAFTKGVLPISCTLGTAPLAVCVNGVPTHRLAPPNSGRLEVRRKVGRRCSD